MENCSTQNIRIFLKHLSAILNDYRDSPLRRSLEIKKLTKVKSHKKKKKKKEKKKRENGGNGRESNARATITGVATSALNALTVSLAALLSKDSPRVALTLLSRFLPTEEAVMGG